MEQKPFAKNFTLLVLGQASSLFGNYILRLALSMYALEVTGSAAVFAGILSIATIPTILLSPIGGILADRADRRNIMVGLPFLVRAVLGLDAKFYGGAESALAVATILGSIAAGLLTGKLRFGRLSYVLAAIGVCIIPAGVVFLFPSGVMTRYAVIVVAFCGMQAAISIFSIFAVSMIQQNTPDELIGKVMAYTSAVSLCAQPVGQMVYGFLFDRFQRIVYLVLIPSGIVVCVIGLLATVFFRKLEEKQGGAID